MEFTRGIFRVAIRVRELQLGRNEFINKKCAFLIK